MSSSSPSRAALPTARGVLLATSSAALAISAHGSADGEFPHLTTTILLTAVIGWAATAAADRTRGVAGVLLVLGSAQLAMHLVLTELSDHAAGGMGMTLAHVVATVVTALLLAHAESMLLAAVATLYLFLPLVWSAPPVPSATPGRTVVRPAGGVAFAEVLLRRVHGRRGPPVLS
ncbi:hypothetical protein [Prauserella cavernicola]|uniref:MFS transporter n=1 Tax=Prauserella cavernicola TaxID=2800127 RepID=A0A934V3L3_9PSEU|nr:hypothetical protein [Prauserella cavernicola]MBK1784482.1 hypothetical protein [Prauserella cavernicola]